MENFKKLKAIIIGPTGGTGRQLTDHIVKSENWSNVTLVVRRKLPEWDNFDDIQKLKIKYIEIENLDFLSTDKIYDYFKDSYDSVFCCLGSRVGNGKEEFIKVDYTYVVNSAEICEKLKIPHFSLISSIGVDSKSFFLYTKTKGKADEEVMKKNIDMVSIYRPGALLERNNDFRIGEWFLKYIPFFPKIDVKDLSLTMMKDAERFHRENKKMKVIFTHSEILNNFKLI